MSYHLYLKELTNYDYLALANSFKTEPLKTRSPCSDVSNDHLSLFNSIQHTLSFWDAEASPAESMGHPICMMTVFSSFLHHLTQTYP